MRLIAELAGAAALVASLLANLRLWREYVRVRAELEHAERQARILRLCVDGYERQRRLHPHAS